MIKEIDAASLLLKQQIRSGLVLSWAWMDACCCVIGLGLGRARQHLVR